MDTSIEPVDVVVVGTTVVDNVESVVSCEELCVRSAVVDADTTTEPVDDDVAVADATDADIVIVSKESCVGIVVDVDDTAVGTIDVVECVADAAVDDVRSVVDCEELCVNSSVVDGDSTADVSGVGFRVVLVVAGDDTCVKPADDVVDVSGTTVELVDMIVTADDIDVDTVVNFEMF